MRKEQEIYRKRFSFAKQEMYETKKEGRRNERERKTERKGKDEKLRKR